MKLYGLICILKLRMFPFRWRKSKDNTLCTFHANTVFLFLIENSEFNCLFFIDTVCRVLKIPCSTSPSLLFPPCFPLKSLTDHDLLYDIIASHLILLKRLYYYWKSWSCWRIIIIFKNLRNVIMHWSNLMCTISC